MTTSVPSTDLDSALVFCPRAPGNKIAGRVDVCNRAIMAVMMRDLRFAIPNIVF